ncbi:MAG: tripartite tricarboxylate transporter TctB family protein [Deltaproteobacteria bacterium]|nr:tripartite tricarboxylate transporter TctB family protein [Deltaproteobacteria bacterium]
MLNFFFMVLSAWAVVTAFSWPWRAAFFPIVMGLALFCFSSIDLLFSFFVSEGKPQGGQSIDFKLSEGVPPAIALKRTVEIFSWIIAFYLMIQLLGFHLAVPAFVLLCLRFLGRERWSISLLLAALSGVFFYGLFDWLLNLPFPQGWLKASLL